MRIVQISDTHVTHLGGMTARHFERVVDFVNATIRPDLVVHTGDMVALDPDDGADRRAARRVLACLDAPVRCIPGNHDVGDLGRAPFMGKRVTPARIRAFREAWGADRWHENLDERWAAVGIDSQLLGSGLPEESEQWEWLESAAAAAGDRAVLVFSHKPLWRPDDDGRAPVDPLGISVPPQDRARLLDTFAPGRLAVVASGHLHRSRVKRRGDVLEVWAPSVGFALQTQDWKVAPALVGVVEYGLFADGVEQCCWQVPGLPERAIADLWDVPEMRAALDLMKPAAPAADARHTGS